MNDNNDAVLQEFFIGVVSGNYYDGLSHQLYLDTDNGELSIHSEASSNSWLSRDDGSLALVLEVSGYCDVPENERYTDECSLSDFGYSEWLHEIDDRIAAAVASGVTK